jgi:hypothetical protein
MRVNFKKVLLIVTTCTVMVGAVLATETPYNTKIDATCFNLQTMNNILDVAGEHTITTGYSTAHGDENPGILFSLNPETGSYSVILEKRHKNEACIIDFGYLRKWE